MAKQARVGTGSLTAMALVAFAANSYFNKAAFADASIDPGSFAIIRLASAALALSLIASLPGKTRLRRHHGSRVSALWLFVYATTFSVAYVDLGVGTGALILFAAVQLTMILAAIRGGESVGATEWGGVILAIAGLALLLLPGLTAPSLWGALLMSIAGIAWGNYSLRGRSTTEPLADTAANFLRTLPLVFLLALVIIPYLHVSTRGVIFALLSGVIASGIGYTIWYSALRGLSTTEAAVVQLLVPVLAALAGFVFLAEMVTGRFVLSSAMILAGVALAIMGKIEEQTSKSLERNSEQS